MNIINKIKSMFLTKTMSANDWKKGMLLSDYGLNSGVSKPFAQSTIVYVAATTISQNLPQAPLDFFNRSTNEKLSLESPIVRLFSRPNKTETYFTFFEELTLYLALYGETFIWIGDSVGQRAGLTTMPGQLVVLNPTRMQHVVEDGNLKGWIYDGGHKRYSFSPEEVLQMKFPNPYLPLRGLAPIDSVMGDVDTDFLASRFSKAFFQNSANPSLVFTLPEDDESSSEQKEEFIKEWNKMRRGSSKQYKTALLAAGMDVKKTGLTQEEMDYVKQREFSAERILAVYKVPPPMAGFYEQATYGNVRTAKRIFWNETIKTYARRYESAINNFFLPVFDPGTYCKFNFSDIDELKHDAKETSELVNVYANHGVPMNTLIEAFDLPFDAQENLDIGYQSMTMLPIGTNFIEIQQDNLDPAKQLVNITPNIFDDKEKLALEYYGSKLNTLQKNKIAQIFSKILHNYWYRQREKILKKITKDVKLINDDFWNQENDRLVAKFEPIYAEYGKKVGKFVNTNVFNRKMVDSIIIGDKAVIGEKIRQLYNKFDKTLKQTDKSRLTAISEKETGTFLEQTNIGDTHDV